MITSINEFKQRLNESSRGAIYHFIFFESLQDLTKNWTDPNPRLPLTEDDLMENIYSISTTRKYNFLWANVRLTFDAEKVSHKFKIMPISYFGRKPGNTFRIKDEINQYEERIVSRKPDFLDIKKYCVRVDFCTSVNYGSEIEDEDLNAAIKYFEGLGIATAVIKSEFDWTQYKPIKQAA